MGDNHSVSSSKASSSSSRGRTATTLFSQTFPIFPFLNGLETDLPTSITAIGLVIQFVQMIAFSINPHILHGESLEALTQILYTSHLPFWDPKFMSFTTFDAYVVLFFINVLLVLTWFIVTFYLLIVAAPVKTGSFFFSVWRLLFNLFSTILYIPMLQGLLSMMVCDADSKLWTLTTTACYEGFTLLILVVGIIAFIVFFFMGLLAQTTLFHQDPDTWKLLSRAHVNLDVLLHLWKTISCVLFHILLSKPDKYYWLPMYMLFSGTLFTVASAFYLPYFKQPMNRLMTGAGLIIASTGIISYLSCTQDGAGLPYQSQDIEGFLFFGLFVLLVRAGSALADFRINRELLTSLPSVLDSEAPPIPRNFLVFPSGLPVFDLANPDNRDLVVDVAEQSHGSSHNDAFEDQPDPLLTPFLTRILCDTDVEVATRFIRCASHLGGLQNKKPVLMLASRIYTKGLTRYYDNGKIIVALAYMISAFAEKQSLALLQAERIHRIEASFATRYHSFKLQVQLKLALNVRDASYQKMCDLAKKFHKETLILMNQFWMKLCVDQVDVSHLSALTSIITQKRHEGSGFFNQALEYRTDRGLLLKYAGFLEQVMIEPEKAEALRMVTKNEAEERRKNAMRGSRPGTGPQDQAVTEVLAFVKSEDSESRGDSKVSNRLSIYAFLFLLLLVVAGIVLFAILSRNSRQTALDCVDNAAQARTLMSRTVALSLEYLSNPIRNTSLNIAILNAISSTADDFLAAHNRLTKGNEVSSTTTGAEFLHKRQLIMRVAVTPQISEFESESFWNFGFEVAQRLVSIVPTIAYYNNGTEGNAEYGRNTMGVLSGNLLESSLAYNLALNASVTSCVMAYDEVNQQSMAALGILFAAFVVLSTAVMALLSFSSSNVTILKQSIISLFPLIPRNVLDRMALLSKDRVDSYDENEDDKDVGKGRLEADPHMTPSRAAGGGSASDAEGGADNASPTQRLLPKAQSAAESSNGSGSSKVAQQEEDDDAAAASLSSSTIITTTVVVLLLAIVAALCAANVSTITTSVNKWEMARKRLEAEGRAGLNFAYATDSIDEFFQTAQSALFKRASESIDAVSKALNGVISLNPTEEETSFLAEVLTKLEDFRASHFDATAGFAGNMSNLITLQFMPSAPSINAEGERRRDEMYNTHGEAGKSRKSFIVAVTKFRSMLLAEAQKRSGGDTAKTLSIAQLAVSAIATVCIFWGFFTLRSNKLFNGTRSRYLALAAMIATAIVLALSAALVFNITEREVQRNELTEEIAQRTEMVTLVLTMTRAARAFTQTGSRVYYNQFFDASDRYFTPLPGALRLMSDRDLQLPSSFFAEMLAANASRQREFRAATGTLRQLQRIAIRLGASAYGLMPIVEVQSQQWDFPAEPDATEVRMNAPVEAFRYTNSTFDLQRPAWQQLLISRFTMFSPRYIGLLAEVQDITNDHFQVGIEDSEAAMKAFDASINSLIAVCLALSVVAAACMAIFVVFVFADFLETTQRGNRGSQGVGLANAGSSSSYQDQDLLSTRFSFAILVAVAVAALAVGMLGLTINSSNATNLGLSNAREWVIARSLTMSNRYLLNLTDTPLTVLQGLLTPIVTDLQNAELDLYFTGAAYNLIGRSKKLDAFLFSPNQMLAPGYQCSYKPAMALSEEEVLRQGGSHAYGKLGRILQDIIQSTSRADAVLNIERLRRLAPVVLLAMRESSDYLKTSFEEQVNLFFFVLLIIGLVLGLLLICTIAWVVVPVLRRLATEQAGSKLLLRLIPPAVRENVPAIADFLEMEMQSDGKGSSGDSAGDSSTFPVVAIDSRGIVLKFNPAAEVIFGYTAAEVIGNNVSILMPERIARSHDGFLSAYRRTGIRRVIGYDRQVHGRHKSGELFPVQLSIKEFKRDNGEFLFFGFIKDISKNLQLKGTEELNNLVQEYATVPMIAIDSLGTVLRFNKAAEECFDQPSADVVNHNIKMLMPEDVAARHDSYLAAYLRTREKHVIDSVRRVFGLRKSGETFPLEINVKEITTSDFGAMSTYLGFCRDLTADLILDEANRINDEVADLSPIPIIGIDPYGKVLKFSSAACRVFGYDLHEVLDKNIKMLMPENIAEQHDRFLETFRQTGKKKVVGTEREVVGKAKDGTLITFLSNIREVRKEGQAIGTFVGYFIDCTESKKNAVFKAIDDAVVELHSTPLVAIDAIGTITRCNKALLQEFGYRREEVLNKNVKMLMPPEVSAKHDGYLSRYQETRVPNVVGTIRRMFAKRKIGTTFPVEIKVDEVIDGDGKSSFIGFLRNLTEDLNTESAFLLNNTIMEISLSPMIGMEPNGIIRVFSKAAEISWKRKADTVIGQNVKMLMPDYYAKNHDMYLEKYAKTRVKNIIDTNKIAEAIDADGHIFPVELFVREINTNGMHFFVAYCRDKSKDGQAQQVIQRNEQISELSPLPLLQIDLYGAVVQYNAAAQLEFQWRREEVLGRNIKMLLPDDIAKNHDSYLATYRKTRVKSVIGALRRSRGKRKDGSTFAVEISVNEVVVEGDAERNTYIGYIRDVTEELRLIKANEVSGVISELSPSPLVAINLKGLIISFNRAAAVAFGFADPAQALNQNVKILMTDDIAARHDGFLIAYAKTRQKHVVDTTRAVKGKKHDGSIFPVEISVREINKEGKEATYLSYIRDCTEDLQMAHATKVSEAVQTLSAVPMITINKIGTIVRVNRAAPLLFQFATPEEMVGKNIKALMPPEIAIQHDRFLSSYLKTGVKSVIDSVREVRGLRQDGSTFPAEISVRELKIDEKETLYIGYLEDIASKQDLQRMRIINDSICNGSPVPLIRMDTLGTIKLFSPAAQHFWDYTEAEVLGQNIKMLMPEYIAKHHDGYLARYVQTKVKTVIDSTKVAQAKIKSGEIVTVSLTIRELVAKDGTVNYVGYVKDMRAVYGVERALSLTSELREMMSLAIIVMDEIGTLRQFNRAATQLFGFSREEVVGNNVKMLMPAEVAAVHDGYLRRYQQTHIKHVIDSSRNVIGIAKDGKQVYVELQVSEFMENGKSIFVAYAIDRSAVMLLAQSAQIADALVTLSAVPIIIIDAKNCITRFNITAEQQFGYTAAEVIGQNVRMLMPNDVAEKHDSYVGRYRTKGGVSRVVDKKVEVVAKRKDGTTFPAELNVREVAKMGRDSSFVGYLRDITQDLVFRSNAIMCEAIESVVPDPIIVINEVGIIQTFTPPACEVFGYTKEEVLGQNLKMLMPPEIASVHDGYLSKYAVTGVKHVVNTVRRLYGRRKDGSPVEVELRIRELVVGNTKFFVGYVRDCSRDYLLTMETELGGAIMELNPDAIITIDTKGIVQRFNAAAEKIFDFDRKHIVGRNIKVLMPDAVATRHDQYLAAYLKSRVKRIVDGQRTVTAEKKNGDTFQVTVSVREILDEKGDPTLYIGTLREVKPKK